MLEHLFGSKTRVRLLRLLFRNPGKEYFVRELARMMDSQINAVRRELEILLSAGIIKEIEKKDTKSTQAGASLRKYYGLNTESIVFAELQALLSKAQLMGEQKFVRELQGKAGNIKLLVLTGRFTHDDRAPSDMLLVGDIKERSVEQQIVAYEKEFGFPIRFTIMTEAEFADRRYVMDKFIFSIFECNHVKVVNTLKI